MLYGILIGLLTGIRIGGLFVIFFIILTHILLLLGRNQRILQNFYKVSICYILLIITWLSTTILCYPASWSNPLKWFRESLSNLSQYAWTKTVLFNGEFIPSTVLPWNYIPVWLLITIPLVFQVAFILGILVMARNYTKFSNLQRAVIILVGLQIFFLPIMIVVRKSIIYDEVRHVLFMIPGVAVICSAGLIYLYKNQNVRLGAIALIGIIFTAIVFDMTTLHPYGYLYFNRVSGGLKQANHRFETEYWGLSLREATEWLNKNAESHAKIMVGGAPDSAAIFSNPNFTIVGTEIKVDSLDSQAPQPKLLSKPYYFLAIPRWNIQNYLPQCQVVYRVIRQDVPLSIVKHCE